MTDTTILGNSARAGLNLGQPSASYPFFKNYMAYGNPGFEPMLMQQVFQFQAPQLVSSPTTFQWNVNNTQFEGYDQNQWAGATFSVVQGSYVSGKSDPVIGCTGTVKSSANQNGGGPIFVINSSTNQGSNGCAGPLGIPGQVIIVSTNNNMPNVYPTPSRVWETGNNGLLGPPTLSGGATISSETTDLCADCGQQSLLFTIPKGGSVALGTGGLSTASEKTVVLNGEYTVSFWAKSNAPTPPQVVATAYPRSGSNCSATYSGSTTPAITSTWTQYSFTCNFDETASAGGPWGFGLSFIATPVAGTSSSLEFDNWSFTNNADVNPTAYSDAFVSAMQSWCQTTANTTGPACTLRYGPSPDSETMANWVKPAFQHQPSLEQMSAISTSYSTNKTNIFDFLNLCAYVGATPVVIFPVTTSTDDAQNLVDFLEGPTSTPYGAIRAQLGQTTPWVGASGSPFSTVYLEFGNENWNGVFLGHALGFVAGSPSLYYDYQVRATAVLAAAHARQSAEGYSLSATKWVLGYQTASGGDNGSTALAKADVAEINGYTGSTIDSVSSSGCTGSGATNATCQLFGPTLAEPYSNTHDPNSVKGFRQFLTNVQRQTNCGANGNAQCQAMVYEENTSPFNASTAGPLTQSVADSFAQGGVQGVIAADQMGENDAAGIVSQNEYQALQYWFGEGGVNIHMWGTMLDIGGDCSAENSSLFGGNYCPRPQMLGAQIYNWCKIGPMVQTSWSGNPTYSIPAYINSVGAISNVPILRSYAFAQGNQRCMVVVNTDVATARPVTFSGFNQPGTNVTTYQFAPPSLTSSNEAPNLTVTSTLQATMSNTLTPNIDVTAGYTLPAHSVTAFLWTATGNSTAPVPTISPAGGSYTSTQSVTVTSSVANATIYYTTDGTAPTTTSAVYSGPISVTATETIKAIATGTGYTSSAAATATYTITALAATPALSVASGTYSTAQVVTITDATPGVNIYFTTNGGTPTTSSQIYSVPIIVGGTETITAIAGGTGFTSSSPVSATYTILPAAATPTFSVAGGNFSSSLSVAITSSTPGAKIYYTTNGIKATPSATSYGGAIPVYSTETISAISVAPGYSNSVPANVTYNYSSSAGGSSSSSGGSTGGSSAATLSFPTGFTGYSGKLILNGTTALGGAALQLTGTGQYSSGTVWSAAKVNVQSFTTDFTFQILNPVADGMTFAIQNNSNSTVGASAGCLGYGWIPKSMAIKFDLFNNEGEGSNSTGLFTGGTQPIVPAIDLTESRVNLHSGHVLHAHLVYNGSTMSMTLTDTVTNAVFRTSFKVNIPAAVGGPTAYVGFTGGTGFMTATQQILTWTYGN